MIEDDNSTTHIHPGPPLAARLAAGAGWGAIATVVMSAVMLLGVLTGISPMPKPIPVALAGAVLVSAPKPLLVATGMAAHLIYGAAAGAVFAGAFRRPGIWVATGYGVALWILMGLAWLPYLGWGPFGTALTPKIAVATLILHVVYGATLGVFLKYATATVRGQSRTSRGVNR